MGVQVNLTFSSVDEAIVALGKMVFRRKPVAVAPLEPKPVSRADDAQGARGRGQPRGPYKNQTNRMQGQGPTRAPVALRPLATAAP
jgi:hypothetical protein